MSYGFKLLFVSLAAFFLVHAAMAMTAGWLAPRAIRAAERMRPRAAARFLLMVRFVPLALAFAVVAGLCVPSYLRFEPDVASEHVAPACLIAAALCLAVWGLSLARVALAIVRTRAAAAAPMAVVGILRTRIVVSGAVQRTLSPEEMAVALRHEAAHAASRDNFKRLLLLLAPDALPGFGARLATLATAWKKFAEWAADDEAAAGDVDRAASLACALVCVARLGRPQSMPLATLLTDGDFAARIDRLLNLPAQGLPDRWTPAVCSLCTVLLVAIVACPAALTSIHELMEALMR